MLFVWKHLRRIAHVMSFCKPNLSNKRAKFSSTVYIFLPTGFNKKGVIVGKEGMGIGGAWVHMLGKLAKASRKDAYIILTPFNPTLL